LDKLYQQQFPSWFEKLSHVGHGSLHLAGGMEDIGGENQIIRFLFESLLDGIHLDVELPVCDQATPCIELLPRFLEESS
jgi:hypothetical protein